MDARIRSFLARAIATLAALAWALPALADGSAVLGPEVLIENPGHCIAPAQEMRRNHPDMLKHQRDITVHAGTRGARVSLNACIACHANRSNGSVLGSSRNFCQGCHEFAAVRLDCFECHQSVPDKPGAAATPLAMNRP